MKNIKSDFFKIVQNSEKADFIRKSHEFREELLQAIQQADSKRIENYKSKANYYLEKDKIGLSERVHGDTMRSYKNIMLSHNSMYALVAERGGLDPALSHYMSEKYAIMIESSELIEELLSLHLQFLTEYSSPKYRMELEDKSLSAKVETFISNNFMYEIDIQLIADELFITKEHLMRMFKKETGFTINEVLKEKRLEEALSLLACSNCSITDIALMIGYSSSQYFSQVFKREYKMTPTQYKATLKHENN